MAVKDYGNMDSCWAFVAMATVESDHYIKTEHLVPLYEQQLVDCANITLNHISRRALEWIAENDGITMELDYS
uniref:Peptidase C1A papain C-terminal domain-containing protein n=1 Tax=Oryza meridionalis TaxID=40149 RepID=A0A0E0DTR4_9ORYZ